jgi:hypothetical protein
MIVVQLIVSLLLIYLPGAAFAQAQAGLPCARGDKECAVKAGRVHVIKKLAFWEPALAKPIEQRIGVAPPELVEFLNLDNIGNDIPNQPHAATLSADFMRDVQDAFAGIPPRVRRLFSTRLVGIYFIEDIGGTGFTDQIDAADGKPVAGFVVLDPSVLEKQTANAWETWKENTPFKPQAGFKLVGEIESKRQDNRINAIQYIMLHELGHVLSIGGNIHPSWTIDAKDVVSTADYPFFELSWSISKEKNRYLTLFDAAFPQRKDVVFYFGAKLSADQMLATYDNLERTNFSTLYSVNHPGDDFAEAFASYVHTVLMKKPFAIRIYRDGKLAKTYQSCWQEKRCAKKRKILEQLLGGA